MLFKDYDNFKMAITYVLNIRDSKFNLSKTNLILTRFIKRIIIIRSINYETYFHS